MAIKFGRPLEPTVRFSPVEAKSPGRGAPPLDQEQLRRAIEEGPL